MTEKGQDGVAKALALGRTVRRQLLEPTMASLHRTEEALDVVLPVRLADEIETLLRRWTLYLAAAHGGVTDRQVALLQGLFGPEAASSAAALQREAVQEGGREALKGALASMMSVLLGVDAFVRFGGQATGEATVELSTYFYQVLELLGVQALSQDYDPATIDLAEEDMERLLDRLRYGIKAAGFGTSIEFDEARISDDERREAREAVEAFVADLRRDDGER